MTRRVLGLALALALAGCRQLRDEDAVSLVRCYDGLVIEAFRAGDAAIVDPVTGPAARS